jgi:diacylglycerol kinase family enzyme
VYYYIIDPQNLSQRQFERVQNQLYSSLSDYRINGETVRATALRPISHLVESAISKGTKTIVAVGNDDSLHDVINATEGSDITLGFIPLEQTKMGYILGIKSIDHAAKIIAARRTTLLDLGRVEQIGTKASAWFIKNLTFGLEFSSELKNAGKFSFKRIKELMNLPSIDVTFIGDKQFKAKLSLLGGSVINARDNHCGTNFVNPTDGVLDVLLLPKMNKYKIFKYRKYILNGCYENIPGVSVLHVKRLEISTPEGLNLRTGSRVMAKAPAIIQSSKHKLKIIAGRERIFS